ncbi:type II toxin-antitoxin system RelE/ParE family toxin [Prosthecobacter sp.]|uniref:type II toxin-antitoxin system RelE/ParE family toxin n=1 Tax=Prosthecobacter sp. TaxID=1965333 RepID=UPI00378408F3
MTLHFELEALEEYRDAALYSQTRFDLGEAFVQAMEAARDTISHDPTQFQSAGDGVRIFCLKRFPYHLYYHYQVEQEKITIYAVAHHSRRPGYWRKRLK